MLRVADRLFSCQLTEPETPIQANFMAFLPSWETLMFGGYHGLDVVRARVLPASCTARQFTKVTGVWNDRSTDLATRLHRQAFCDPLWKVRSSRHSPKLRPARCAGCDER